MLECYVINTLIHVLMSSFLLINFKNELHYIFDLSNKDESNIFMFSINKKKNNVINYDK